MMAAVRFTQVADWGGRKVMRSCEFCSAAVDDSTNQCTGCGAAQSTPAPAPQAPSVAAAPVAGAPMAAAPAAAVKPQGSWGCLIGWIILFWPVAIIYYLQRRWN